MPAVTVVDLSGFNETVNALKRMGGVVSDKVLKPAMRNGAKIFTRAAADNARHANRTYRKQKRTNQGKHLWQAMGLRLRVYSKNGVIFVAAGGLYQKGGYHAHLVELGHRIVHGGTIDRIKIVNKGSYLRQLKRSVFTKAGWEVGALEGVKIVRQKAGITAAGKRWLQAHGMESTKRGWKYTGKRAWMGMAPGAGYIIGNTFAGRSVRGGGTVSGKSVQGYPFMKPAWNAMKRAVLAKITDDIKHNLVDQCVAVGRANGAVK